MSNDGGACANVLPLLRSDLIAAGHLTLIKKPRCTVHLSTSICHESAQTNLYNAYKKIKKKIYAI